MDHGEDAAAAAAEDAHVRHACQTTSAMQMPGPVLCSVGMSNEGEGCPGGNSVIVSKGATGHDGSSGRQFPATAGESLPSAYGGICSAMSIDTITVVTSCVDTPMSMSRDEEVPTPPLLSSKHGKFKKSLEDRFRGQGMEHLSPTSTGSLSPAYPGMQKALHVECATPAGGRGDSDRKSRSVDESDRRSRSMDEGEVRGIRSNSFDPGTIAAGTLSEDSPLDLSRSATGAAGMASACSASTSALTDRDVCRSLFEARARERHLRKRSESEENIRWQHDGRAAVAAAAAVASAVPRSAALGRLCYSDAQIDRSGRETAEGMAAGFARSEARQDVAHGAATAAGGLQQFNAVASAHFAHRHNKQHRQKSSSPSAGRSLQQRRSPKVYSSLDDGSASVQSDDDGRPMAARSRSGSSHSLSTATTMRPSSTEGTSGSVSMLSTAWRLTPPPFQSSASMASVASDGMGSPVRHSPGASAASADDGVTGAAGSLDDPNSADSPGSAAARLHFCHVCDRSFSRSDMLTRHVRLHTGLKPYECQLCGQLFSRSDHLSTHQRTHTGERPYRCPHCPYAACRRDMITRHLRVHGRSSSGGGSSEDDIGCGLIASATHVGAAAAAAAAASATTVTASNDVKAKRRRLLQRGPWSSGSSGGSAAAGDGSSSWDSSSYSFGSSSIESSCGGSMDVAGAAAAAAAAAYGLGSSSVGSAGSAWLHAPRIDPSRIWRWSSNGSSGSSSSGLGLSLGCSSPDVGGGSGGGGGSGRSAAATGASLTTALPPFADSWADACDRAGLLGEAGAVMAGRQQQQAAVASGAAVAGLERGIPGSTTGAAICSVVGSKLSPSAPVWSSAAMMSFGYGRTLAAGPMPAAAVALLCATQPQALAFLTSGAGDGGSSSSSGIDRSHAAALLANSSSGADAANNTTAGGGGGGSAQSLTCSDRSRLSEGSSAAVPTAAVGTTAKERKSLVRQDASMEQEDEPPSPAAADAVSAPACPPVLVLPPLPPLQQQLHKSLPASGWHDYSQASRGAAQAASLADVLVTTASVASLTVPRLSGIAATGGGEGGMTAPRQASLSDELGKVTMTE